MLEEEKSLDFGPETSLTRRQLAGILTFCLGSFGALIACIDNSNNPASARSLAILANAQTMTREGCSRILAGQALHNRSCIARAEAICKNNLTRCETLAATATTNTDVAHALQVCRTIENQTSIVLTSNFRASCL